MKSGNKTLARRNKSSGELAVVSVETLLSPGAAAPRASHVVSVPGTAVSVFPLDIPGQLRGAARERVALRQITAELGQETDRLRIWPLAGQAEAWAWSHVLVADRELCAEWRSKCGPKCMALLPDFLTLPWAEGIWCLSEDAAGHWIVRLGEVTGFGAEPGIAMTMLEAELRRAPSPSAIYAPGGVPEDLADLAARERIDIHTGSDALLVETGLAPRTFAHGELACDMRVDPQAARDRLQRSVLPWRWPVAAGLVAFGLWCGLILTQSHQLTRQEQDWRAATTDLVRKHFVPTGPLVDIRLQVTQALEAKRAASANQGDRRAPLDVLNWVFPVLDHPDVTLEVLQLSGGGDEDGIIAILGLPDFAALDQTGKRAELAGLNMRVINSGIAEDGQGITAQVLFQPAEKGAEDG